MQKAERREVKGQVCRELARLPKGCLSGHKRLLYICLTSRRLCYESRLQAEPITANETISDFGIMEAERRNSNSLISHIFSFHLHNYRDRVVCVSTGVDIIILLLEVTAHTHIQT